MSNTIFQHRTVQDYKITLAGQQEGTNLRVSISICSPSEQFKKSQGRRISEGRLKKGIKSFTLPLNGNHPAYSLNSFSKELATKEVKEIKKKFSIPVHAVNQTEE